MADAARPTEFDSSTTVRCAHPNTFHTGIGRCHSYSCSNASHQHEVYLHQTHSGGHHQGHTRCRLHPFNFNEGLPFFPRYESQWLYDDKLLVAWFEVDFCQSRYNSQLGGNGSNACTLIAILLSSYCSGEKVFTTCTHNYISYCIIKGLGLAMVNGNNIYNNLKEQGRLPSVNLSVPEAITCAGKFATRIKEWKSVLYMQPLYQTLFTNAQAHLEEWNSSPHAKRHSYLFMILITDKRSVLFMYNKKDESISLLDSHQHSPYKGALIAVVNRDHFKNLCNWFSLVIGKFNESSTSLYELSFLYHRRK